MTGSVGRRERNKLDKLGRIVAAADELFAERSIDEVTTQEIAERADIGTGTLFLYARTKGELLLLVQNATYAAALERGRAAAEGAPDTLTAVMAIVAEVVACNRSRPSNGRTYLREMVFGDPDEPHHREARALAGRTEQAIADLLADDPAIGPDGAGVLAHIVAAIMLLAMAAGPVVDNPVSDVLDDIRPQIRALLPHPSRKVTT